jgi:hypothetical protein
VGEVVEHERMAVQPPPVPEHSAGEHDQVACQLLPVDDDPVEAVVGEFSPPDSGNAADSSRSSTQNCG